MSQLRMEDLELQTTKSAQEFARMNAVRTINSDVTQTKSIGLKLISILSARPFAQSQWHLVASRKTCKKAMHGEKKSHLASRALAIALSEFSSSWAQLNAKVHTPVADEGTWSFKSSHLQPAQMRARDRPNNRTLSGRLRIVMVRQ